MVVTLSELRSLHTDAAKSVLPNLKEFIEIFFSNISYNQCSEQLSYGIIFKIHLDSVTRLRENYLELKLNHSCIPSHSQSAFTNRMD